jgi:hypothetical protein
MSRAPDPPAAAHGPYRFEARTRHAASYKGVLFHSIVDSTAGHWGGSQSWCSLL